MPRDPGALHCAESLIYLASQEREEELAFAPLVETALRHMSADATVSFLAWYRGLPERQG